MNIHIYNAYPDLIARMLHLRLSYFELNENDAEGLKTMCQPSCVSEPTTIEKYKIGTNRWSKEEFLKTEF